LGPPRDELSGLAATLDHLLSRIAASRRHEQNFASDAAHQLRTPVTALRARAELALSTRGTAGAQARELALQSTIRGAIRLEETIKALLKVARKEPGTAGATVDAVNLVHSFEGVHLQVPARVPLAGGDPTIARQALAPLVENAHRHANSQVTLRVSCTAAHVTVAVHDDGPGLDAQLGERAFEPGVRGPREPDGGAGLGLAHGDSPAPAAVT
jgi:signal transduction histidine kinase